MGEFSSIPVKEIQGRRLGKTLLVTAGMDGDELAGIEAAQRISERFSSEDFDGRLMVIPIVNREGYTAGTSENPLDGKLPKLIFPGRANGSASEQLVHGLVTTHLSRADAWLDLHGGATDEYLRPFLWLYKTGVREMDALNTRLMETASSRVLYERAGFFSKAKRLSRQGKWYVMAEAGALGRVDEEAVEQHLRWVEVVMQTLGMLTAVFYPAGQTTAEQHFCRLQKKETLDSGDEESLLWWHEGGPYYMGRIK